MTELEDRIGMTDEDVWARIGLESPERPSNDRLCEMLGDAMSRRVVCFMIYDGTMRLIEPYCVGYGNKQNLLLRAYQLDSATEVHPAWRLFSVQKIEGLLPVSVTFDIRPEFKPGDTAMTTILAECER